METNQSIGNQKIQKILGFIALLPFIILILSSIGIFLYQLYLIAKYGNWISISIYDITMVVLNSIFELSLYDNEWLENNWLGVYKILRWIPASLTLFILSWVVLFFIIKIIDTIKKQ